MLRNIGIAVVILLVVAFVGVSFAFLTAPPSEVPEPASLAIKATYNSQGAEIEQVIRETEGFEGFQSFTHLRVDGRATWVCGANPGKAETKVLRVNGEAVTESLCIPGRIPGIKIAFFNGGKDGAVFVKNGVNLFETLDYGESWAPGELLATN